MATIRKRGARWEAQVRRRGLPTESRSFQHKVDALAWASIAESQIERGQFQSRTLARQTCFDEVLVRYRDEVTPLKKGADVERIRIEALRRSPIAALTLDRLDAAQLGQWRDERLKQVSGSTVNRGLNLISHVLNTARREWGYPVSNPVADIRRPKNNRARRRRLSPIEERKLMAALTPVGRNAKGQLAAGTRNTWIVPLFILALETGMRRSELLSMDWSDVHLDQCFVRLHDTKNGDCRDVPLSSRARECLLNLNANFEATGAVLPLSAEAAKLAFARAIKRAGISDFHFHDLRHEATSRLATRLSNVLELSAVTGHKTLSMLQRYYHPSATDLAKKLG